MHAGAVKAVDQTRRDWVVLGQDGYDRDRIGCLFGSTGRSVRARDDHVYSECNQLSSERWKPISVPFCGSVLDFEITPLAVSQVAQPFAHRFIDRISGLSGAEGQCAYDGDPVRVLRQHADPGSGHT